MLWAAAPTVSTQEKNPLASARPGSVSSNNDATDAITIPRMLSYQGKLTDSTGRAVQDSNYPVTFRLYTVPSGGSAFWSETQSVQTKNGLFAVLLGSVTPVGSVPDGGALYLGMEVGAVELTPRLRLVSAAYAYKADTANYALAGAGGDDPWVRGLPDSVLYTIRQLGIARGGANNMLYGTNCYTHVNLGIACTTGVSGADHGYCTVGGGMANCAAALYATVAGGDRNVAGGGAATVSGGWRNSASGGSATIGGGESNVADSNWATVSGGYDNTARGRSAVVAGGSGNMAGDSFSTVGGGVGNTAGSAGTTVAGGRLNSASDDGAVVGGGKSNTASYSFATVSGGTRNTASGPYAMVPGGYGNLASGYASVAAGMYDTVAGMHNFAANTNSTVSAAYNYSAAFNGEAATASGQLRCGVISKAGGSFTIDHPLDPDKTILNHYFAEGPEMLNIYRGSVVLDAAGRAEVSLPDYFDALNRNPMIQLTGVGSSDVFVAHEVTGNAFVIGGKPGIKVYWQVTGDRKDVSAEAIRAMMPVEQPKTGALAGRMLDDDFLSGCMEQLVREGKAAGIDFRTAGGRMRYEQMKQRTEQR